jgi:cell division protein FtsB
MNRVAKNRPTFSYVRFAILIVVFLVCFFSVVFIKEILQRKQLDQEVVELNQELEKLKIRKQGFLDLLDEYKGDFYAEQESRSKLNLKKEGEKVVVVKLNQQNKFPQLNTSEAENFPKAERLNQSSNLELWWSYFFEEKDNL